MLIFSASRSTIDCLLPVDHEMTGGSLNFREALIIGFGDKRMINLLIVENSPVFAEALVRILQRQIDLHVVKVVDTAEKALEAIPDLPLDLVLVDTLLPQMSGIELVQTLYLRWPKLPCLIVSGDLSSYSVRRSIQAGARGYVIKDRASSIGKAIRRVLDGRFYCSTELQAFLPWQN